MTTQQIVQNYLDRDSRFRERKNKNKGIYNLLIIKYPILKDKPRELIIDFIVDFISYDRSWRKILLDNKELRGSDYDDKETLSKKVQRNLGYLPSDRQSVYEKDIEWFNNLKEN